MKISNELLYAKTHEWVKFIDETTALVGISDFAQNALGGIVFITLPEVGEEVIAENGFGDIESVKAVSDLNSPVTGKVKHINESLLDDPAQINEHASESWILEIEDITDKSPLMNAAEYETFCKREA